jgi:hypothetical protein
MNEAGTGRHQVMFDGVKAFGLSSRLITLASRQTFRSRANGPLTRRPRLRACLGEHWSPSVVVNARQKP